MLRALEKYLFATVGLAVFIATTRIALADTVLDDFGVEHGTGYIGAEAGWEEAESRAWNWVPTAAEVEALPDHYDSRTAGAFVSPVRSQGSCGSCWAHARTEAFEAARAVAGRSHIDLSVQDLLVNDHDSYGCNGGFFSSGFEKTHGLALQKACPYAGSDQVACSAPAADHAYAWGYIGASGKAPTVTELRAAIYRYKVIMATVAAGGSDWQKGGHMKGCRETQVNHLITLVGYDKQADGTYQFIGRNSWGVRWGDKGDFYMAKNCDALASQPHSAGFITATAKGDYANPDSD